MAEFIKGLELCEKFFNECAKPVIDKYFPDLQYSADYPILRTKKFTMSGLKRFTGFNYENIRGKA